jgi:hypothetical protein
VASGARADTEACARVLERSREMRAAGKLKDALAQMNECTECPALEDVCEQTRDSMRRALPTLAVRARTCDGTTLDAAVITIDGETATSSTTVDPGRHDVRAEVGKRVEEQTVFVAEGEHRSVSLVVTDPPRPTPLGVWALSASGAGGLLAAATLFAVSASLPAGMSFLTPISHDMSIDVVDHTKSDFAVAAGVALAVSVTAFVTALVVYLTRPFPHPKGPD